MLCRNEDEPKGAKTRVAIIASLERKLAQGDKALLGSKGYRRLPATPGDERFNIDPARSAEDERFDGVCVLRTNTKCQLYGLCCAIAIR